MFYIGTVSAVVLSAFLYRIFRESLSLALERNFYSMRLSTIALKDIITNWSNKCNINDYPLQTGKTVIITGGSRGISVEVVKLLLKLDMEVIVACRNPVAGEKMIKGLRESGIKMGQTKVYKLDNSSLKSVRDFAAQIRKDYQKIHVLINNAAVMFTPYKETENGFEEQWGVNYLSHFLLTALLLPLLKAGGIPGQCSRIVNITSCALLLGNINFEDTNPKDRYVPELGYIQSKFAQQVFTLKLQDLLQKRGLDIKAYCVHPGIVLTDLFRTTIMLKLKIFLKPLFKSPDQGAVPIVYTSLSKDIEEYGGAYINNCSINPPKAEALDPATQDRLFELSLKQTQLKDFFQDV